MKYGMGAALGVAAILAGAWLPAAALADENTAAETEATAALTGDLQQELEARLRKDAETMAADALMAASNLELPLEIERINPRTLVLVSDL